LHVVGDEIGVDGDRCGGALACGGDDLGARVHDVARRPHTINAGAAGAVDDGEPGVVEPAAEAGEQAIGVGMLPGRTNTA